MNVVAINTSPEKEWGAVSLLLDPYLEGLREAEADVELHYARDLLIFPCCGNLNCTVRTPGQCMAYDDMRWLRRKIGQADVLVLASPLYFDGRTGPAGITEPMKRLEERLALARGFGGEPYPHAIHTTRETARLSKVVIVAGHGFVEIDGFNPVLTHLKAFCHNTFPEMAGSVTGGCRVRLSHVPPRATAAELVAVARAAGRRLAADDRPPAVPSASGGAADGGKRSRGRREWEPVTLFELGVIH